MSQADYDPNAGVPEWINIVVPIVSAILFAVALVAVYFMKYEIPVEKLEDAQEYFSDLIEVCKPEPQHPRRQTNHNTGNQIYTIGANRPHGRHNTNYLSDSDDMLSKVSTYSERSSGYFFGSHCTMITLESQV